MIQAARMNDCLPLRRSRFVALGAGFALAAICTMHGCDQSGTADGPDSGSAGSTPNASATTDGAGNSSTPTGAPVDDRVLGATAPQASDHPEHPGQTGSTNAPTASVGLTAPVAIDPPFIDFGRVKPNEVLEQSVELKNVGRTGLHILASSASCNCTTVNLSNVMLQPNESVSLDAVLETSDQLGTKNATITVLFDGYEPVKVAVRAQVGFAVQAEPPYIGATRDLRGEITVSSIDGQPFRILSISNEEPPYVEYNPQLDPPRNAYRLAWDFTDVDPNSCVDSRGLPVPRQWVIETDHPEAPVFDVMVRHICHTRDLLPTDGRTWVVKGTRALLPQIERGESGECVIEINWLRQAPVDDSIEAVISNTPRQFTAELIEAVRVGSTITCRVKITPNPNHRGLIMGSVTLQGRVHSATHEIISRVADR